jgi:SNF2 family DNA or RNA helicase
VVEASTRVAAGLPGPFTPGDLTRPALVITPNGLRRNYRDAILHGPRDETGRPIYEGLWPSGTVQILDGSNPTKRRQQLDGDEDFFITNWEKLRTDSKMLAKREWRAVIASEAHRAKNRDAQQTKGFWRLRAPLMIAETGTPVMNDPSELWSLLRWLLPEQFAQHEAGGGFWPFFHSYVDSYQTKHGFEVRGIKNADELRFVLADKLVRRTKKMVLPDLPEKLPPRWVPVEFNDEERKLYAAAEEALFLDVKAYVSKLAAERFNDGTAATVEDEADRILDELADLPLDRLTRAIPNGGARIAALRQITAQAKARGAVEIVRDNWQTPQVVFTWFVEPARWIKDKLEGPVAASGAPAMRVGLIAGQGGDATEIAQAFQRGETDQIVCTIAKGGMGLDLYRSSHAIMADQDWVPAINDQAVDRLHRQGQKNPVNTTILYVPDTVDDGKVAPKNRFKRAIVTELFGAE